MLNRPGPEAPPRVPSGDPQDAKKRVLAVLEVGDRIPSGVVRGLIYSDLLRERGFDVEFASRQPLSTIDFLDGPPAVLRRLVQRHGVRRRIMRLATERNERRLVDKARDVDIVYMSKVLSWPLVRALREQTRARLVLDFGDAIWQYQSMTDLPAMLGAVDAVTTDNEQTAEYVRRYNPACTVVPDSAQTEAFDRCRESKRRTGSREVTIGWIGSPGTAFNLYVVWEALEVLAGRYPDLRVRLVGVSDDGTSLPPFERVRYSLRPRYGQAEMIDEVFQMDIGIFPLQDVERCRVRGVLKASIYMSGEIPVVCSPVGQCTELITDGVNGMLARSTDEWIDKLDALIRDADLRRRIGAAGLETVRERFRLEQCFAKLEPVLLGSNAPNGAP